MVHNCPADMQPLPGTWDGWRTPPYTTAPYPPYRYDPPITVTTTKTFKLHVKPKGDGMRADDV